MINKDDISRMYSGVTPSKKSVEKCLECVQQKKANTIPMKRILLVAACVVLIVAVLVPTVGAQKLFKAYDALDEYSQSLPYPEKQASDNSLLQQSSTVATGEKTSAQVKGLKITAQDSYFDGTMVCLSFVGEYDGEYKEAFRFDYTDTEKGEEFIADAKNVTPLYQGAFFLLSTEDKFSGMLRLPCYSDKDEVKVSIKMPYLQVSDKDDNVLGEISGDFSFNLNVKKSEGDIYTYSSEGSNDEVYIKNIVSSAAGLNLVYFVPDSMCEKASGIQPIVTDENGNPVGLIEGRCEEAQNGTLRLWRCEAITTKSVDVTLYDKNNTDGCTEELCVVAEFNDIVLR